MSESVRDTGRDPESEYLTMAVEQYRTFELTAEFRHEYVEGIVYAMTRPSLRHNRIVLNIVRRLLAGADGGPCRVYSEAVRVQAADRIFYYPDVAVACGRLGDLDEEASPCLLVEVLSPSTASIDRREKLMVYRRMPTVQMYLIVYQDRRLVDCHFKLENEWHSAAYVEDDEVVEIPCPQMSLTVAQIYADAERVGSEPLLPGLRRVREPAPL